MDCLRPFASVQVLPNIHAVHMNAEEWGDPEVFRPERFLTESGDRVIGKDRILPFSIGKKSLQTDAEWVSDRSPCKIFYLL